MRWSKSFCSVVLLISCKSLVWWEHLIISCNSQWQLQELMETLSSTEPHYIRCIKPNNLLKPATFENINVLQQLRCSVSDTWFITKFPENLSTTVYPNPNGSSSFQGVLEAIRINCAGYPTRKIFHDFLQRFHVLAPEFFKERLVYCLIIKYVPLYLLILPPVACIHNCFMISYRNDEKVICQKILDKMGLEGYQVKHALPEWILLYVCYTLHFSLFCIFPKKAAK